MHIHRRRKKSAEPIEVVDLFAGPGGLGEGFASLTVDARKPYAIAVSIEKDPLAHKTLELRSFRRQLAGHQLEDYRAFLSGRISRAELFEKHSHEATRAADEARCIALGPEKHGELDKVLDAQVSDRDRSVVIGGPPCQAYSLVGRSRNQSKPGWSLETDHRSTLYREYLRVIARVQPAAFVMENVRGLLSAKMHGEGLFGRILGDLHHPAAALSYRDRGKRYVLIPLTPGSGRPSGRFNRAAGSHETDFIVAAERHGVPQARSRVIIVGIREDCLRREHGVSLAYRAGPTVHDALEGLPRVRSGISGARDSYETWIAALNAAPKGAWYKDLPLSIREQVRRAIERASETEIDRGAEFIGSKGGSPSWLNHSSRGHMATDLHRYLFAASWAREQGVSPRLADFPRALRPDHANVDEALSTGLFADRFRVQVWDAPSTTIVSHISKDGHYYIHPDPSQCRSLTVREAARLQTFPDDYFFCGPRTSQYHQVGNAVPVRLSRQIAKAVLQFLGQCD